jgi:carbamoylphosphate synthase large subunit
VFNTAEGQKGKARGGFYPALFDELGFPYTGSDAHTLYTTRDKTLTQRLLSDDGVTTPQARLVTRTTLEGGSLDDVAFAVIVKPNFDDLSTGISGDFRVCKDDHELSNVVDRQLDVHFLEVIRAIVRSACKRRGLQHLIDNQAVR